MGFNRPNYHYLSTPSMATTFCKTFPLLSHPRTPNPSVRRVEVGVERDEQGLLRLTYRLEGTKLRVPKPGLQRRGDRLWEHTCFEAFLAIPGEPGYHEFNFAPSRAWSAKALRGYRDPDDGHPALEPRFEVARTDEQIVLEVALDLEGISSRHRGSPLRMALAAMIEDAAGGLSYWALHHPPGRPDFHHADSFVLEVPGSGQTGVP